MQQSSASSAKGRSYSVGTGGITSRGRSPNPLLSLDSAQKPRSKSLAPRHSLGVAGQGDDGNANLLNALDSNLALSSDGELSDDDSSLQDLPSSSLVSLTIPESEQNQDKAEQDKDIESPEELVSSPQDSSPAEQFTDSEIKRTSTPPVPAKKRGSVTISEHVTVIEDDGEHLIPTEEYDGQNGSNEGDQVLVSSVDDYFRESDIL